MKMSLKIVLAVVYGGLLILACSSVGRVQAADPVMIDAFSYQVENATQVAVLQQALCKRFRYEPEIFDPVYVVECQAYYGPDKITPIFYPARIQSDPWCEDPPAITNPEACGDFANRMMVAWFEAVIEKNDTALQASIEDYIKTAKTAAAAGRGTTRIKANK